MGTVSEIDLRALRSEVEGIVIGPHDREYDQARAVWNSMHDRRPAVVVQAESADDVCTTLGFAQDRSLRLAVRGGGHSVAGYGTVDGGMLSRMQAVEVDSKNRLVRAQPGVTLGVLDQASTAHGLVVPIGVVSKTGVAGPTLGGGVGWLTRAHGLALDNLRSAQVVTADGQMRTASAQENADLFWGLRGGGGNFGVIISFEFEAHPIASPAVWGTAYYRPTGATSSPDSNTSRISTIPGMSFG